MQKEIEKEEETGKAIEKEEIFPLHHLTRPAIIQMLQEILNQVLTLVYLVRSLVVVADLVLVKWVLSVLFFVIMVIQ